MKDFSDEEIQKMLEQQKEAVKEALSPGQQKELDAYDFLFRELKKEPPGGLTYNFSTKIVAKIAAKNSMKNDIKAYAFAAVALLFGVAGLYFLSTYINYSFDNQLVNVILSYKQILIFISVILIAVQYFDQKLIKHLR